MKYGLKEIRISMGVFDFDVICVVGDLKKLEKYVCWKHEQNNFEVESKYGTRGLCIHKVGWVPIIWIPKKPKTPREHATLAHECIHAVYCLFDWANLRANSETEEVMTHSTAHLITEILKHA